MKNKFVKIATPLLMALLLTGCWDSVEIDKKAFVSAVAIDVGKDIDKKDHGIDFLNMDEDDRENLSIVKVTYDFPDIRNMDTQKGTTEKLYLSVDGYSLSDAYIKATSKTSRSLHFGHSKLLLLSEEVYNYPSLVNEFMDYIERTPSINRAMMMAIVEGSTEDYLKSKPMQEDGVDNYITNLLRNNRDNGSFKPVTVTKYIDMVKSDNLAILPIFKLKGENDIELIGGAIIEDYTIKDKISKSEMDNIQILDGDVGACKKVITNETHPIDYYIENVNTDMQVKYEDDKLYINYNVDAEGDLSGYYSGAKSIDNMDIQNIESEFSDTIEKELLNTIHKVKDDMEIDILGIKSSLEKYHPMIWIKVKDDWPRALNESVVSVSVDCKIRTIGISN